MYGGGRYQGPSPDEVALVEGARQLGFEFVGRTRSHLTISFQGHQVPPVVALFPQLGAAAPSGRAQPR